MGREGSRFVITELLPPSAVYRGGEPARFEWDAEHRSAPQGEGWPQPVELRTKRTNYPGGDAVTEQVLGSSLKAFTLRGRWSDKWNTAGFSRAEWRRFEDMVRRGNLCRFEWRDVSVVGLVVDFEPSVAPPKRPHDVDYKFTVSPHRRGDASALSRLPVPRTTLDPKSHQLVLQKRIETLDVPDPPPNVAGSPLAGLILRAAADLNNAVADVADAVDAAVLAPLGDVAKALQVLASSFAIVRGQAQLLIDKLGAVRSDVDGVDTSFSVATMDSWVRGLLRQARLAQDAAYRAEDDVIRRAQPDVLVLHQAQAGESLYAIALRYYGSVDGWRLIAQRNDLGDFQLQGGEVLIIPEGPRR